MIALRTAYVDMSNHARNRARLAAVKARPCADCGGEFPGCAMDMDHVTAAKRANVSDLLHAPPEVFDAELARCEPVCAVCHRTRTEARRTEAHLAAADDYEILEILAT